MCAYFGTKSVGARKKHAALLCVMQVLLTTQQPFCVLGYAYIFCLEVIELYSVVPPKFPHSKCGHSRPFNARNTAMPNGKNRSAKLLSGELPKQVSASLSAMGTLSFSKTVQCTFPDKRIYINTKI